MNVDAFVETLSMARFVETLPITMAIFGHARVSQELRCRLPSESPQVIDCDPTAMARPFGAKADDDAGDDVVS